MPSKRVGQAGEDMLLDRHIHRFQLRRMQKPLVPQQIPTVHYERRPRCPLKLFLTSQPNIHQLLFRVLNLQQVREEIIALLGQDGRGRTLNQRRLLGRREEMERVDVPVDQPGNYQQLALDSNLSSSFPRQLSFPVQY